MRRKESQSYLHTSVNMCAVQSKRCNLKRQRNGENAAVKRAAKEREVNETDLPSVYRFACAWSRVNEPVSMRQYWDFQSSSIGSVIVFAFAFASKIECLTSQKLPWIQHLRSSRFWFPVKVFNDCSFKKFKEFYLTSEK